jgi:RNA polymerase sigma factor (sigma-70 family)
MRIGIIARAKQGDLMEALDKREWSQRRGAEFLGIDQSVFGRLINLKWVPEEFSLELEIKLYELTGKTPEELFPEWARQKDFLEMSKVSRKTLEVTPVMLQAAGAIPRLLPSPEEVFCKQDVQRVINEVLITLSPREEKVVRRHVMGDETLDEIGEDMSLSGEAVRQICEKAFSNLRVPKRARILRECF